MAETQKRIVAYCVLFFIAGMSVGAWLEFVIRAAQKCP